MPRLGEVLIQFLQQDISADGVYDFDPTLGDLKVQRFNEDTLDDSFSQIAATISGKIGSTQFLYTGAILDREVRQNADYSGFAGKMEFMFLTILVTILFILLVMTQVSFFKEL